MASRSIELSLLSLLASLLCFRERLGQTRLSSSSCCGENKWSQPKRPRAWALASQQTAGRPARPASPARRRRPTDLLAHRFSSATLPPPSPLAIVSPPRVGSHPIGYPSLDTPALLAVVRPTPSSGAVASLPPRPSLARAKTLVPPEPARLLLGGNGNASLAHPGTQPASGPHPFTRSSSTYPKSPCRACRSRSTMVRPCRPLARAPISGDSS